MKKISKGQKQTYIMTTISVLILILLWGALYLPSKNNLKKLKNKLKGIETQIAVTEGNVGVAGNSKGINRLEEKYRWVNSKFPHKEENALKILSDIAKESGAEILSIKSQPKIDFLDEDSKTTKINGRICRKFIVSIEMKASYMDLVKYIDNLKESLPSYVIVEKVSIQRGPAGLRQLRIVLDLGLHLLS